MSDFQSRKVHRKVRRLTSKLYEDYKIECCEEPTKFLFIGNAGLANGLKCENLVAHCNEYGIIENVIMIPGKSYCFAVFNDVETSSIAFNDLQAKSLIPDYPEKLYISFSKSVPTVEKISWGNGPPGTKILEDFVTCEEENILLQCVNWKSQEIGQNLKHRQVLHFGYKFQYDTNNINKEEPLESKIPTECNVIFDRLRQMGYIQSNPDQLTINQYLPGQGIPPHIDTHSACGDIILSLSLGSSVVMDLKHSSGRSISLLLPQRSMLILSGEARYAWKHGITPRKTDIVPCPGGGLSVQKREVRISFTFRWTKTDDCKCNYKEECDSYNKSNETFDQNDENAAELEKIHVQKVYEDIAEHFSETRHKPWPNVLDFILSLPNGSVLVDIGCGNGKYFGHNKKIYEIGCDQSKNLSFVCRKRGFEVFTCNCLAIPLRDNTADACICIAVIHHLANQNRRLKALQEIVRVLRSGGMALIYVWAKDQMHNDEKSSYLKKHKQGNKPECKESVNQESFHQTEKYSEAKQAPLSLPLHTNRSQFLHKDLLVPWKLKPHLQTTDISTFYRYYHVFEGKDLENMCCTLNDIEIVKCFYDQGNWCIKIKKK